MSGPALWVTVGGVGLVAIAGRRGPPAVDERHCAVSAWRSTNSPRGGSDPSREPVQTRRMQPSDLDALDALDALVRAWRTSMLVDDRPVPHDLVTRLCELATWAPTTSAPGRGASRSLEGDARARLGEAISAAMDANGDPPEKVAKARGKYLRTPATLVVGTAAGDWPTRTAENR